MLIRKIPFGTGTSRFHDDFPTINCFPGPGSYDFSKSSIKSSPSKRSKVEVSRTRKSNSEVPRFSLISQGGSIVEEEDQRQPRIK